MLLLVTVRYQSLREVERVRGLVSLKNSRVIVSTWRILEPFVSRKRTI